MNDIKDRIDKADERIKVLMKKYPVVFAIVVTVSLAVGFVAGALIF